MGAWEKYFFDEYDIGPMREKLWNYTTRTARAAIDAPGINNRAIALEVFKNGGSGYLYWESFEWDSTGCATDNPCEYPWTRWANGAQSYFYPPRKDGPAKKPDWTIVPSLRIMAYREGVDDFEYAMILKELIKEGEAKKVNVSEGKKVLSDIERFFHNNSLWSQNDAWYLDLRDRMGRAIVKIKSKIK